jgi:DNA-binding transcriptional LysR family regulator
MRDAEIPDLSSRQLQTILALSEYKSFIAAASLLKTSQPAITRSLKHIEDILGVRLFDRSTRSVRITTAGKEFVAVAERILNDLRITLRSMRDLSDQQRGQVIVSSIMSVANGQLPRLVAEYRKAFPGIEIHVRDGVHGGVLEDVRSGAADFGITYLGELPALIQAIPLGRESFMIVMPKGHVLAKRKRLALADLEGFPLVSFPSESRTRRIIDEAASRAGLPLHHVATVTQFATMLGFVRAGVGIAIAPKTGVELSLGKELHAIPISNPPLWRELGMICLREREPFPAASGLMDLVQGAWKSDRK